MKRLLFGLVLCALLASCGGEAMLPPEGIVEYGMLIISYESDENAWIAYLYITVGDEPEVMLSRGGQQFYFLPAGQYLATGYRLVQFFGGATNTYPFERNIFVWANQEITVPF